MTLNVRGAVSVHSRPPAALIGLWSALALALAYLLNLLALLTLNDAI